MGDHLDGAGMDHQRGRRPEPRNTGNPAAGSDGMARPGNSRTRTGTSLLAGGKICDFYDPYWRVELSEGDWEELTRRELRHGITLAAQVSSSAQEVQLPTAMQLLAPRASSWGEVWR